MCFYALFKPGYALYLRDVFEGLNDVVELGEVFGFDAEFEFDEAFCARLALRGGFDGFDVRALFGHGQCHGGQQAVAVLRGDEQGGVVGLAGDGFPVGIKLLVGVGFEQVGAVFAVDDEALVFDEDGADGVAGDGVAAGAELDAAGFVAADFEGTQADFAAEVFAREGGDVHGDGHGQDVPHADAV